ncbi:hypothetical protein EON65_42965 [archaeon]|nr:MAG: hypothetical protein EON65_42965 [archaeon]
MRCRDGQGRLSGENLRMEHSKIGLAEAQVKSRVVVLAGKFAMQTGTVTVSCWQLCFVFESLCFAVLFVSMIHLMFSF